MTPNEPVLRPIARSHRLAIVHQEDDIAITDGTVNRSEIVRVTEQVNGETQACPVCDCGVESINVEIKGIQIDILRI